MRVLIVHPDLGVGGAERLILDIAAATKSNGNEITILTNQYDPKHCFADSKDFNIITKFSWMPRHIFGKFHAFFAYLKLLLASMWFIYLSGLKVDAVICDQVSLPNLIFKWHNYKVLFYCHYPDQLLCTKRASLVMQLYRKPLDALESWTTGMADVILVNSQFTGKVFRSTFTNLSHKKIEVLYPSLNTAKFDKLSDELSKKPEASEDLTDMQKENLAELARSEKKKFVFLSINRYERKKDLKLALNAMKHLQEKLKNNVDLWENTHLIMAGGYDPRVGENVEHYAELTEMANSLGLNENVSFMRSISDRQKISLLRQAYCLIYTPTNEHFGIVPIEAMYCMKPVLATNTGGPLETVEHNGTGYLAEPDASQFGDCMQKLIEDQSIQAKFSASARKRVIDNFSFKAFTDNLNSIMNRMVADDEKKSS